MRYLLVFAMVIVGPLSVYHAAPPAQEPKLVRPVSWWSGLNPVSDGGAGGDKQEVDLIAERKELAQAWKYLGLKGTVPEVNFKDYFVLVVRRPLGLDLHSGGLAVAEGGEAKIQGRGVHPDEMNSRIHSSTIAIFPRSGIKTVEKTKLPATE